MNATKRSAGGIEADRNDEIYLGAGKPRLSEVVMTASLYRRQRDKLQEALEQLTLYVAVVDETVGLDDDGKAILETAKAILGLVARGGK